MISFRTDAPLPIAPWDIRRRVQSLDLFANS